MKIDIQCPGAKININISPKAAVGSFPFPFSLLHHSWVNNFSPPNCHNLFILPITPSRLPLPNHCWMLTRQLSHPVGLLQHPDPFTSHPAPPSVKSLSRQRLGNAAGRPYSWCLFPVASVTAVSGPVSCGAERLRQMSTVLSQQWDDWSLGINRLFLSALLPSR